MSASVLVAALLVLAARGVVGCAGDGMRLGVALAAWLRGRR